MLNSRLFHLHTVGFHRIVIKFLLMNHSRHLLFERRHFRLMLNLSNLQRIFLLLILHLILALLLLQLMQLLLQLIQLRGLLQSIRFALHSKLFFLLLYPQNLSLDRFHFLLLLFAQFQVNLTLLILCLFQYSQLLQLTLQNRHILHLLLMQQLTLLGLFADLTLFLSSQFLLLHNLRLQRHQLLLVQFRHFVTLLLIHFLLFRRLHLTQDTLLLELLIKRFEFFRVLLFQRFLTRRLLLLMCFVASSKGPQLVQLRFERRHFLSVLLGNQSLLLQTLLMLFIVVGMLVEQVFGLRDFDTLTFHALLKHTQLLLMQLLLRTHRFVHFGVDIDNIWLHLGQRMFMIAQETAMLRQHTR
mmetsp:Transcript_40280/g.66125  ORF Transcript_40280/g.66125 Transcript_40280/m.66125 type:complete len:356 (-) Transcript_40280:490-1557(-)